MKALIVMPVATADIKVDAVRGFGGEVVLHGANFDEAKAHALELAASLGMTFIPPFDHPSVIAGQATIALELLQQNARSTESLCRSAAADWPPGWPCLSNT